MSNGTKTWSFTYNADGLRMKRTNGTTTYNYVYNGDKLSQLTVGNDVLNFFYDASGTPMSFSYNGANYYYITTIQGDVIRILDESGSIVAYYRYDAWGKLLDSGGAMADINPIRYRGYVYDQECDLYYLQSRYYNPEIGRFLNTDAFATNGQGLLGNNMYAYCNNAPVIHSDSLGTRCVPAGRSTNEGAGRKYYDTPDEAAKAFSEEVYGASMYILHEYGTEIYSRQINGSAKYTYAPPRVGAPHWVPVGYPTPPGTEYVAFAHTHPNNDEFSPRDIEIANKHGVGAYVAGPSGNLKKYDLSTSVPVDIATLSPNPLTNYQRMALSSKYRFSWEFHLITPADFAFRCSLKTWPACSSILRRD